MRLEKALDRRFLGYRSIMGWSHWLSVEKEILLKRKVLPLKDRFWCLRHGFRPSDMNVYGREELRAHYKDYLSARDYYRLHPINGEYSFWIDDKLTMKYVFSRYDEYLPAYYYQLEKNRLMRLTNCPEAYSESIDGIIGLLREKKILAAKRLWGSCGRGFYRLEYKDGEFLVTGKPVSEQELRQLLGSLYSYLILEYVVNHHVLREIWPDATNTLRVLIANCNGQLVVMRSFIRFGNAKSNGVDNARAGGIESVIDEDTGKILFTQSQDAYGTPTKITHHPDSGASFDIRIPRWEEIIVKLKEICMDYPQLRYWGFDVAVTEDSFKILEINSLSGLMAAQCKEPLMKDPKTRAVYEYFKSKK